MTELTEPLVQLAYKDPQVPPEQLDQMVQMGQLAYKEQLEVTELTEPLVQLAYKEQLVQLA